jgi:hypothetical protein
MVDWLELQEERPPKDAVVPNVKACGFKCQQLIALIISRTAGHLLISVPNGSGRLAWDNAMESVMHWG